ncbi:hypothetical protein AB0I30_23150 [Nocardia tengchongensis]|uniref:hypothetical protein n=1 Tax=Nocardia tengchongensis TaxID=2055889 RepID=UPI0033E254E7
MIDLRGLAVSLMQVVPAVLAVPASLMAVRTYWTERRWGHKPLVQQRLRRVLQWKEVAAELGEPCPPRVALEFAQARRELESVTEIAHDDNELWVVARSQPVTLGLFAMFLVAMYVPIPSGALGVVVRCSGVAFWVAASLWWMQWVNAVQRLWCRRLLFVRLGARGDAVVVPPLSGRPMVGRSPWPAQMTRWINRAIGPHPVAPEQITDSSVAQLRATVEQWCAGAQDRRVRRWWRSVTTAFDNVT